MYKGFFDESNRSPREMTFVLAGWLATVDEWENFSDAWQKCLEEKPRLQYFKGSELNEKLYSASNADRERKKTSLAKVIRANNLRGYIATAPHRLIGGKPERLNKLMGTRIYDWAFMALVVTVVVDHLERGERSKVDFIFDGCTELRACIASYEKERSRWPPSMQMVSGTVVPGDDHELVGLQAADLLAGEHSSYLRTGRKSASYLELDCLPVTIFEAYPPKALDRFFSYAQEVYEREEFVRWLLVVLKKHGLTLNDVNKAVKEGGWSDMSDLRKFNDAMDTILRADPKAVKEAMEKESREQAKERAAKGERKRGRKSVKRHSSASVPASSATD